MQITLVSSGDSVSAVLDKIVSLFCVNPSELNSITDSQYLAARSSIRELKEITDFLLTKFSANLTPPKRNSKSSLSTWISQVLSSAREMVASDTTKQKTDVKCPNCGFEHGSFENTLCTYRDPDPETDPTSGLIISFGKTLEFLPHKTVTRRTWKDAHAQKFINAFNQNKLVRAFDKDPRYGGKQIGWCRLWYAPYKERLCDMPSDDLLAEGGMCDTIGEFVQQYFDGNPRLEVWVIRFEFIASLLATEANPVVVADQIADSSSPEIEVLEPEEKPVYKISIHPDRNINRNGWGFTEERVSVLPPYLLDRQGNLFERSSYTILSCDATYVQVVSQHLSNIAVDSGLVVKLMAENLEVSCACICGNPPPFIVDRGGVYKRDHLKLALAVHYFQVISEYLSNIVVV